MKTYIITAAIIMRKEEILLVHHGPEHGKDSYWCLPGGVSNESETAFEGMLR